MAINQLQLPGYAAPQTIDLATPLSQLGVTYRQAQQRQALSDLGKGIVDGSIDYRQAAGRAADMGDVDTSLKFLALDEQRRKEGLQLNAANNFNQSLTSMLNGQGAPVAPTSARPSAAAVPPVKPDASVGVPSVTAPDPAPRAPVASSPTVWGDAEGVRQGIYDPPKTRVAQAPAPAAVSAGSGPASAAPPAPAAAAPAPAAGGFQGIGVQHIPQLLQAYNNPYLPAPQKELAGKLLSHALDNAKPSEKVKTLQELKAASGYQGSILELEKELRAASKTDVTVDNRAESEENKAAGQEAGKRRATMFAAAGAATKTLANLSRIEGLLSQVSQGKLEPTRMTVSAWAKAFGLDDATAEKLGLDPKGVGSAQALGALTSEMVIGKIGAGGFPANNFSDADRGFLLGTVQQLGNDPRANRIITETARRMAQLDLERAKAYQAFKANPANKGKGFEDFELEFSEGIAQRDVFGDLQREAEAIVGAPRDDRGGTYNNPGPAPAPQQQPSGNAGGLNWRVR